MDINDDSLAVESTDYIGQTRNPLESFSEDDVYRVPLYKTLQRMTPKRGSLIHPVEAFGRAFASGFRESNTLLEGIDATYKLMSIDQLLPEDGYNYKEDPQLSMLDSVLKTRFADSNSTAETTLRLNLLKRQYQRAKDMAESPLGMVLGMVGGVGLSAENYLIPMAWARGALKGTATGLAISGLSELPNICL